MSNFSTSKIWPQVWNVNNTWVKYPDTWWRAYFLEQFNQADYSRQLQVKRHTTYLRDFLVSPTVPSLCASCRCIRLGQKRVRLPPIGKIWYFLRSYFSIFGSPNQNVLKSDLKKSRICPIWFKSVALWAQIWYPWRPANLPQPCQVISTITWYKNCRL